MQFIPLTVQLGELIKSFRIRNEKTAKDLSTLIGKTPSYLSKLESGSIKKIDSDLFEKLCNTIIGNDEGIKSFIEFAFKSNNTYDDDTFLTLSNIDDVLYKFKPPVELTEYIQTELNKHNLSITDLTTELNANTDLHDLSSEVFSSLPENIFAYADAEKKHSVIKLSYSTKVIGEILNNSSETNYITLEAMLYALFKLCGQAKDEARISAVKTLNNKYKINSIRKYKTKTIFINSIEDEEKYLGKLEPDAEKNYLKVIKGIRIALILSQSKGGAERIETLNRNLKANLGFTFSFISTDLEKILPLSKELKSDFMKDLNKLIESYAEKKDENTDFFF